MKTAGTRTARRHVAGTAFALLLPFAASAPPAFAVEPAPHAVVQRFRIVTDDLPATLRFWREGFGYRVLFHDGAFRGEALARHFGLPPSSRVSFTILAPPAGGLHLDVLAVKGDAPPPLERPREATVRVGDHGLVIETADVRATVARLHALGADVVSEPASFSGAPVERGEIGAVSAPDFEARVISPSGLRILLVQTVDGPGGNCYLECATEAD